MRIFHYARRNLSHSIAHTGQDIQGGNLYSSPGVHSYFSFSSTVFYFVLCSILSNLTLVAPASGSSDFERPTELGTDDSFVSWTAQQGLFRVEMPSSGVLVVDLQERRSTANPDAGSGWIDMVAGSGNLVILRRSATHVALASDGFATLDLKVSSSVAHRLTSHFTLATVLQEELVSASGDRLLRSRWLRRGHSPADGEYGEPEEVDPDHGGVRFPGPTLTKGDPEEVDPDHGGLQWRPDGQTLGSQVARRQIAEVIRPLTRLAHGEPEEVDPDHGGLRIEGLGFHPKSADVQVLSYEPACGSRADSGGEPWACAATLLPGTQTLGRIEARQASDFEDRDLYRLPITRVTPINLVVQSETDLQIILHDDQGQALAVMDSADIDELSMSKVLMPGTYFVSIVGLDGDVGEYEVGLARR